MRKAFLLPLLGLAATAAAAPPPRPATVTLTVTWLTSPTFELVLEPSPALTFSCNLVPQSGPGGPVLKVCKSQVTKGRPVQLKAHRHFLKPLPSGKVDVPVANSEWTNACAGTKGETCQLPMTGDTTAQMKFNLVN